MKVKYTREGDDVFVEVQGQRLGPFSSKSEARKEAKKTVKASRKPVEDSLIEEDTPDDPMASIVKRWVGGEAFGSLAKEMGLSRSAFRRKLYDAVGGKEKYQELRDAGAGKASAKSRGSGSSSAVSDKGVPVISRTRYSEGWKSRVAYVDVGGAPIKGAKVYKPLISTSIFTDPDGVEYVEARGNERADLIVDLTKGRDYKGIGKVRLRKLDTSSIGRKISKRKELIKRGEKALEKKRQRKRKKRAARRKTS